VIKGNCGKGIVALGALLSLGLAGCASSGDSEGASEPSQSAKIVFWTQHATPQRLAIQEKVAADFMAKTGIEVDVVGLDAASENQAIVAAAASGDMPDVVLHMPDQTAAWTEQGFLDADAAQEVVDGLGAETFSPDALGLVTVDGELQAVPSDGWGEMLYYRTDLFKSAGLDEPTSLEDVATAAQALAATGTTGIVLGTAPGSVFTTQTLEAIALMNGCQLFTDDEVTLDSEACVGALAEYQKMAAASVAGDQDVDSTRAAYLAGKAGMIFWSTHFLDELAGLDANFPLSCEECAADPQYLAKNTGVAGLLTGPDNDDPTTYGLTMNLGITRGANTEAAKQWVEYLMSDAYVEVLSTATEGRIPVRTGTTEDPQKYINGWMELQLGADPAIQKPFNEVYSAEVIAAVVDGANGFSRWGLGTEYAGVAGTLAAQNALAENLPALFSGADPESVAAAMQATAEAAKQDVGK